MQPVATALDKMQRENAVDSYDLHLCWHGCISGSATYGLWVISVAKTERRLCCLLQFRIHTSSSGS